MMEKERAEAIDALGRIHNYCEEIDHHIPEEERTGYKMYPDVQKIFDFLYMNVSDLTAREIFTWFDENAVNLNFVTGNFEVNFGGYLEFKKKYMESEDTE